MPKNKVAIIAAPNGARKQKSDHSRLPISIDEIVEEVAACRDAGAVMVHVHARDNQGRHSLEVERNLELLDALNSSLGDSVLVQLTTEAVGQYTPKQQMQLIKETRPPAASFALREFLPTSFNHTVIIDFFHWVSEQGILSQYILYSKQDVERYLYLCRENLLPQKGRHALFVLGSYQATQPSFPRDLLPFLNNELILNERWGVCAFGKKEFDCLTTAMMLGGDIRVGFENNHFNRDGTLAISNAEQVAYLTLQAKALGVELFSSDEYKTYLESCV